VIDQREASVTRDVREGASTVLDPFENAVSRVSRPITESWNDAVSEDDIDEVRRENKRLRDRVAELEAEAVGAEDARHQLDELTTTLGLPGVSDVGSVAARVTSGPRSNLAHAVEIDKGTNDGIKLGMPVLTSAGLVGRVSRVSTGRATVELITNPDFRVGVRVADTGQLGTARGQGRDEPLVVDTNIEPGTNVPSGSGLVTSGVDRSAYPAAIPIAKVASTREGAGGMSLELVAEPLVDVDRLSYVNVLLWEPPP
jgi:rod shape-determining protein MreC